MPLPAHDLAVLLNAVGFSAEKHSQQRRKDVEASPYVNHPIGVARLIANIGGVKDLAVLVAAVLHDTIEDTLTSPEEIEEQFGSEVRKLVEEVTDEKGLPKSERKRLQIVHAPHLSNGAKLIKLGDKISNVRDVVETPPTDWSIQRRREYLDWAEQVLAGCRGTNQMMEQHFDELVRAGRAILGGTST